MRESIDGEDDERRQLQSSVLSYIIETREKLAEMADLVSEKERSRTAKQIRRGITTVTLETGHLKLGIKCWSCYRQAQRHS